MNIDRLGELSQHPKISRWLVSDKVNVNYFPQTSLRFVLQRVASDSAPEEFAAAVMNFLDLTLDDRAEASPYVFKNYSDFVAEIGEEEFKEQFECVIDGPDDVWSHVQPEEIHILRRTKGDKKIYVLIAANCDWEEEHGIQIVYREGKILNRVSAQDGHVTNADAYSLPEHEDPIC